MATTRFDMRLDADIKKKAERAAALLGMRSLKEYVVRLMDEDASRVIAQHESLSVSDDVFDRFMAACNDAQQPNQALRDAVKFTREKGIK